MTILHPLPLTLWGSALLLGAWAVRAIRRPASTGWDWHGLWRDGDDSSRRRIASGARSVGRHRVVYYHWDPEGNLRYVGKANRTFAQRMYAEGKEIMSLGFHWWTAENVPWWLPTIELERRRIKQLNPPLNRNRGTRPSWWMWLTPWRY